MSQVTLIGRLVTAPELRETASGKHVTTVRVVTNDKSHAEFHDVVLWGQLADFACQYLGKGRLVYIEGRLQSRQWQATDGSTRRTVEIVANRLQALSGMPSQIRKGSSRVRSPRVARSRTASRRSEPPLRTHESFTPVLPEDCALFP